MAFSESFGIRQEPYKKAKSMLAELKKEDLHKTLQYMKSVGAEFFIGGYMFAIIKNKDRIRKAE